MTATKEKYAAQLRQTEEEYSTRMGDVMRELLANAWRGKEYRPNEPFADMIWSHIPGEESNFDLTYKVEAEKHLAVWLFKVKWQLPFPGFSSFLEEKASLPTLSALPNILPEFRKSTSVDDPTVQLIATAPLAAKTYQIYVKLLTGKTVPLNVQSTDTLQMVKAKVEYACGTPQDQQKFIFGTKQLVDGKTLGHYGIEREATLTLVPGTVTKQPKTGKK